MTAWRQVGVRENELVLHTPCCGRELTLPREGTNMRFPMLPRCQPCEQRWRVDFLLKDSRWVAMWTDLCIPP